MPIGTSHSCPHVSITPDEYPIALSLAGAASGGTYLAGFVDFLFEALQCWHQKKDDDPASVPGWKVRFSAITGASAGAATSMLASSCVNIEYVPYSRKNETNDPRINPMYDAWVRQMNITDLANPADLDGPSAPTSLLQLGSLLYGNFFPDLAEKVMPGYNLISTPQYFKDIQFVATTSNLRGVRYSTALTGTDGTVGTEKIYSFRHTDYVQVLVTETPNEIPPESKDRMFVINANADRNCDVWEPVKVAAAASAAFPAVFPSVKVSVPKSHYNGRLETDPDWRDADGVDNVYPSSDGGLMNNYPIDLATQLLEEQVSAQISSSSNPNLNLGALISIIPFPDGGQGNTYLDDESKFDGIPILRLFMNLASALFGQANFRYSNTEQTEGIKRFQVVPERGAPFPGQVLKLATGTLFGFGGFIDEKIREHDFLLGRKNCQDFLRSAFTIGQQEALASPVFNKYAQFLTEDRIPIIPLVGTANIELEEPTWPGFNLLQRNVVAKSVTAALKERVTKIFELFPTTEHQIEDLDEALNADVPLNMDLLNPATILLVVYFGTLHVLEQNFPA